MSEEVCENVQSSVTPELRKMKKGHISPLLAIVVGNIQRDRAKREERVEECKKKRLQGMSLALVGND
jgi:hypothetical protein